MLHNNAGNISIRHIITGHYNKLYGCVTCNHTDKYRCSFVRRMHPIKHTHTLPRLDGSSTVQAQTELHIHIYCIFGVCPNLSASVVPDYPDECAPRYPLKQQNVWYFWNLLRRYPFFIIFTRPKAYRYVVVAAAFWDGFFLFFYLFSFSNRNEKRKAKRDASSYSTNTSLIPFRLQIVCWSWCWCCVCVRAYASIYSYVHTLILLFRTNPNVLCTHVIFYKPTGAKRTFRAILI